VLRAQIFHPMQTGSHGGHCPTE
jgi:hypothetical protein